MARKEVNIGKVYSRLENFWKTDKYTDVTIICENKHFKCHRLVLAAACKYFDAMFVEGRFCDSVSEHISLPEMNAGAFEQVLQFIYTGDAQIDSKNVFPVLQASEFFELPGIEDLCVDFLEADGPTVQDTLNILMFARATGKESLINLLSLHIANHFEIFSKVDGFLEISFDDVRKILSCFTGSSMRNEETLLTAITRWICNKREERLQYLPEFNRVISFENISSTFIQYMFTKSLLGAYHTATIPTRKPIGYSEDLVLQVSATSQTETLMHVFIKHLGERNLVKVYSINSDLVCSVSENPILLKHPYECIDNVALDSHHIYRLHYQGQRKANSSFEQSFYACTSVNTSLGLRLKPPPVNSSHFGLCALKNNIYAYYSFKNSTVNHTNSSNLVNEQITCGICAYNCEVDDWFPVPQMKKRTEEACITSLNNILYLIGGASVDPDIFEEGYAQTYDCREGIWQKLPRTHHSPYVACACCPMNGKVYIYSGCENVAHFERFDPVAGRWEKMVALPLQEITFCEKMVSYLDQLFVMGGIGIPAKDLTVDIFDVKSCTWNKSSVLTEISSTGTGSGAIVDVVIF